MKKALTVFLTAVLLLSLAATTAFAAGRGQDREQGQGTGYVDANDDGICDYADSSCHFAADDSFCHFADDDSFCHFVDEDGDGVCDYRENGGGSCGEGQGFADKDNDGVCDYAASQTPRRNGCGRGYGAGRENGGRGCHGGWR